MAKSRGGKFSKQRVSGVRSYDPNKITRVGGGKKPNIVGMYQKPVKTSGKH